jgi:hypothetical protein
MTSHALPESPPTSPESLHSFSHALYSHLTIFGKEFVIVPKMFYINNAKFLSSHDVRFFEREAETYLVELSAYKAIIAPPDAWSVVHTDISDFLTPPSHPRSESLHHAVTALTSPRTLREDLRLGAPPL